MSNLMILGNAPLTMSSREIADLVEARHNDVVRARKLSTFPMMMSMRCGFSTATARAKSSRHWVWT